MCFGGGMMIIRFGDWKYIDVIGFGGFFIF